MMNLPLNIDIQQILLHMLNLVLLFFILYFILYKPVRNFMEDREKRIKDKKDEADRIVADAEKIKAEYEEKLKNADIEIEEKMKANDLLLEARCEEARKKAEKTAEETIAAAKKNAENEKKKIIDSAKKEIDGMIDSATDKLSLSATTSDIYDKFIAEKRNNNE